MSAIRFLSRDATTGIPQIRNTESPIQVVSGAAALTNQDEFVRVDNSGGNVPLTLPAVFAGRQYLIQLVVTGSAYNITLGRTGSEKINGVAATFTLPGSDAGSLARWHVWCDGTDWWVG